MSLGIKVSNIFRDSDRKIGVEEHLGIEDRQWTERWMREIVHRGHIKGNTYF